MTARYQVLSPPRTVSMGEDWFDMADTDHFWIRRRFDVLRRICGADLAQDLRVAEIGCGSGIVQAQFQQELGIPVDGFDLDARALERNGSDASRLYCYDIHDRSAELADRYDVVLLLDVLEHVEDDAQFLRDAAFPLKPGGRLVVNVPASERLFSKYDRSVGHLRRYAPAQLLELGAPAGLREVAWTYWGLPLLPLALARKLVVKAVAPENVIRTGWEPPQPWIGRALDVWSKLERIPQQFFGTSLMVVFEKERS